MGGGDAETRFAASYGRHRAAVLRRRVRSVDAEDLVAQVSVVSWRRVEDLPAPPADRLWLFGIAHRVVAAKPGPGPPVRKSDPLHRARRLLTRADERLDTRRRTRLLGLPDVGDPQGDVRTAGTPKKSPSPSTTITTSGVALESSSSPASATISKTAPAVAMANRPFSESQGPIASLAASTARGVHCRRRRSGSEVVRYQRSTLGDPPLLRFMRL